MQPPLSVGKLIRIWFNDSFQQTCSCAIFFHLENQHGVFFYFFIFYLSPSPSSRSVIKFTLSPIYLEINLIPAEKRGWALALYLPLRFMHLIPLGNPLCLCQPKNPPQLLKHVLPKMCFFKDKGNTIKKRISITNCFLDRTKSKYSPPGMLMPPPP